MDDKDIVDNIVNWDGMDNGSSDFITISLDETMGATTTYSDNTIYGGDYSFDFSNISINDITFESKEFENCMPSIDNVNKMCEVYPGLAKAYENFKTAYKLVEQDYKGKINSGELDDDFPF